MRLASLLAALLVSSAAVAGPKDLGPKAAADTITISIYLNLQHPDELARFIDSTVSPGPNYHRFLTVDQFADRFGATDRQINKTIKALNKAGIAVSDIYPSHLVIRATGTVDQFNTFFGTSLHNFANGAHKYQAPAKSVVIPVDLADTIASVSGLSTQRQRQARHSHARTTANKAITLPQNSTSTGIPGEFTVGDVADQYQVNPLYKLGIDGRGATVGIATLAGFDPKDAEHYWKAIGLKTKGGRIKQVHVDGGGDVSPDAGSDETTLDVEQAGGMAPGADLIVYDAPNTDAGFLDLFYKIASDNKVDSFSISWGDSEIFTIANDVTDEFVALDQALMEAAAQGISVFASSGDDGAYDTTSALGPDFQKVLSVDSPSSDPYMTAAGGTTAAGDLPLTDTITLHFDKERVWGWSYLIPYVADVSEIFSAGGGGGVSSFWPTPSYQQGVAGIKKTEKGQSLLDTDGNDYLDLPAKFAGRNVPDISLNGDPDTGFLLYYTGDGSGWTGGWGGTSFVAPQLNGITGLMNQVEGRVGFLNPQLYRLQGTNALNDVKAGDNWFYNGQKGYEPGAGLGSINATNLLTALLLQCF
ncbi:MAG: S8/S53 family peptidase [Deltaproteobacteria bacterium]|nr:S8/S53 family peptidase [Deltaproteobacteria bacterium]